MIIRQPIVLVHLVFTSACDANQFSESQTNDSLNEPSKLQKQENPLP